MIKQFYAPGTRGYVYYKALGDKCVAQWGGFESGYQRTP